jgi:hypothetical protein
LTDIASAQRPAGVGTVKMHRNTFNSACFKAGGRRG